MNDDRIADVLREELHLTAGALGRALADLDEVRLRLAVAESEVARMKSVLAGATS
jgi:hypothetical protein